MLAVGGCEEHRFPTQTLYDPNAKDTLDWRLSDTLYVQQYPNWEGFNHPQGIAVGFEPLLYVADTDNDRVAMLDLAGRVIGYSPRIKRPVALAEDRRLQLLVCAEFDTLLPGQSARTTFGAVYRLNLVAAGHNIAATTPARVFFDPSDSTRRYTGVATMYDDKYYVSRVGPKNAITYYDRDNAILLFEKNDSLMTPVTAEFSPDGTGLLSIHAVTGIATLPTGKSVEFVFSQVESNAGITPLYKVQWIRLISVGQTTNYVSKFYPSVDGDIDLLRIKRFTRPSGVTLDPSGTLFVTDAATDSLYTFSTRGIERYSFGGTGSGQRQFRQPSGVAYFDKTVYVADRGNNRIVRFKLSTDLR